MPGAGGQGGADNSGGEMPVSCDEPPPPSPLVGWAGVPGSGSGTTSIDTTTGGDATPVLVVSTLADLNAALMGTAPAVVQIAGITISGNVRVGSNKTIVGTCGAAIQGHVQLSQSTNVIIRNLKIVGYNCQDPAAVNAKDCSAGADAVTVTGSHHIWFDHDDILDGSDGNLDINQGADNITISWTKFHYSKQRVDPAGAAGGHEFSDLIGSSDNAGATDAGHLRVTFHHDWWGDNAYERMPRVRFGQIHLFNNLWTPLSDAYCIGLGVSANILAEKNAFHHVNNPFDVTDYADASSVLQSVGNLFEATSGNTTGVGGDAATPPYDYFADEPCAVVDAIMAHAGPQ